MLRESRGFTIIQLITAMTVAGLLVVGLVVHELKAGQQDDLRRGNLALVQGLVSRYAENHLGRYPSTQEASMLGSDLQMQFDGLRMLDPKTGHYYVLGSDFGACNGSADTADRGPGYVSYKSPGADGPYALRICLEKGEFYVGN